MSLKRARNNSGPSQLDAPPAVKRRKGGFVVGPANLPDGLRRRKVQRIKENLIHRAKVRKDYAKVKQRERSSIAKVERHENEESEDVDAGSGPDSVVHMLDQNKGKNGKETENPSSSMTRQESNDHTASANRRRRKPQPFSKEIHLATQRKAEKEERQRLIHQAGLEQARKNDERLRFRKEMMKASRVGKNGQRKLGRESKPLLEKIQRLMS